MIVSERYSEEERILRQDPVIIAMAHELAMHPESPIDFGSWGFILGASREYARRGGLDALTIGGPARAIEASLYGNQPFIDEEA